MTEIWKDAVSILETASAVRGGDSSEIAILLDERQGMRIVDAAGWQLDALKREYNATTAFTVKRNTASVVVEASSGCDQYTLKKNLLTNPLAGMAHGVPKHLIQPEQFLLS